MTVHTGAGAGLLYNSADDNALIRRYHELGDVRARQELIERHLGFVRRLAQRYAHRGETIDDLTQVGCVGLIKAVDRYDGKHKVTLATYAAPNILGEIKRHFRDKGWAVRVPRDVQELNVKLGRVVEALESSRAYSTVSLSERADDPDEDSSDPLEALGDLDDGYQLVEQRQLLRQGFRTLADRERAILHMRFFLGLTQSEIAERVGISQMHVSRLIRQSVDAVRAELGSPEPELAPAAQDCGSDGRRRKPAARTRGGRSARLRATS